MNICYHTQKIIKKENIILTKGNYTRKRSADYGRDARPIRVHSE